MRCQSINEDTRRSYPDLHVTTLLGARNLRFVGSSSKGIESVIQILPQVLWESSHSHFYRYVVNVTRVTNSQPTFGGYGRQSGPNVSVG